MTQRTLFGWTLVGAFCAVVSCGGGDNGPKGFGVACTNDTTCEAYDLVCGDGKCVQCLGDADCRSSEVCTAGLCKAQQECAGDGDCSGGQVCDDELGACVDCVTTDDCKTGQACMAHNCRDRPSCDFTSDCSDGLVCESDAHICVTCRDDRDCGLKRVCVEYECVAESSTSGGSGNGGSGGSGGSGKAGSGNSGGTPSGGGAGGNAGTSSGGLGAIGGGGSGGGGSGGTLNEAGTGGNDCPCVGTEVCTPDERCVEPTLLDDLEDCDDEILAIEGRRGDWAADADTGVSLMYGFSNPGPGWTDNTCAAWATGGEISLDNPNTTFAFIGFRLNVDEFDEAHVYDLSGYSGLQIKLESSSSVQVVLKTSGGGYFQVTLPPFSGSNVRSAPFLSMSKMNNSLENLPIKLATVTEIQFSVTNPKNFDLAVHRVELY